MIDPGDVATLAQFASGARPDDTDHLTELMLKAATDVVRRYCEWHVFPVVTETVTLDGPGGWLLTLPSARVESITSIVESGQTLTVDDYSWSATGRVRKTSGMWTDDYRAVTVTMEHGYSSADDLLATIYSIAARAGSSPQGIIADNAGPFSTPFAQLSTGSGGGLGLFPHEKEILDRYALVRP